MLVDLPPDHPIQALSDAVHRVLVEQTPPGLLIGQHPRPVVGVLTHGALVTSTGRLAAASYDGVADRIILPSADIAPLARAGELYTQRRRWSSAHEEWAHRLTHEHLHAIYWGDRLHHTDADIAVDEAAVEAFAADVHALVVRRVTGRPAAESARTIRIDRPVCVTRVRVASTVATGATSWDTPPAAMWRMRLVMAPPDERARMLTATGTNPAEVCP